MNLTDYAQNCGQSMFSEKVRQIILFMYVTMFSILSKKTDYKTMYSNIPFVETILKCRKNDL